MNTHAIARSAIEGPRWAGIRSFLYDVAIAHSCELTILNEEKSFLHTHIHYKIEGAEEQVRACVRDIKSSIEHHNSDEEG